MPIVLYSANSSLAYEIAEQFYGGRHFVWCAPNWKISHVGVRTVNPPSSHPLRIYRELADAAVNDDQHCAKLRQNRLGILRGAEEHLANGSITQDSFDIIVEMIEHAKAPEFNPLLYVIPFARVEDRVVPARPTERANVLSREFKIRDLASAEFDVLVFP